VKNIILGFLLTLSVAVSAFAENEDLFSKVKQLAEKEDAEAQYHLGMFYNNGIGTPQNIQLAFEWFQKSAAGNDPLGNYKLGCYYSGQGQGFVDIDHEKAIRYKSIAAKAGYRLAQHDVAGMLFNKGDTEEAIRWLKVAGDQGDFDSLYALFNIYYLGKNIEKNNLSAYLYLNLAATIATSEMPPQIKSIMSELSTKISADEKNKADKIISEWKPLPTPLTIRALNGLQTAKDSVAEK